MDGENKIVESIDWTDFGQDAKTVRELTNNPHGVHDLLKKKRMANSGEKAYRESFEEFGSMFGLKPEKALELKRNLSSGSVKYTELDNDEIAIVEKLIKLNAMDYKAIGISEDGYSKIMGLTKIDESKQAKPETKQETKQELKQEIKQEQDSKVEAIVNSQDDIIVAKLAEAEKRTQEYEAKIKELSLKDSLRNIGVINDRVNDASKLWTEPEFPEGVDDSKKNEILTGHIDNFKERFPIFFSQETEIKTHDGSMTKSPKTNSNMELAKNRRDVNLALKEIFK